MNHTIPLQLIELEEGNYHLALTACFEGAPGFTWVVDTGASKTVFDKLLSEWYEPPSEGEETRVRSAGIGAPAFDSSLAILKGFRIGELEVAPIKVALLDLTHINQLYFQTAGRKICGLIGSDFLLENRAVIDYGRLELTLRGDRFREPATE